MDADKLREDIVSPLLKVSTYKGYTLTGPKEAIVRRVYASQVVTPGTGRTNEADGSFTQLNFRCLGTSPTCMLNARARLVVPLRFYGPANDTAAHADAHTNAASSWSESVIGPRRNGLLKAFSSISTIINNVTSFSVRPDEALAVAEQCFTAPRVQGMTGVNNEEEQGWWGPDVGGDVIQAAAGEFPIGDLQKLGITQTRARLSVDNRAFAERRGEFLDAMERFDLNLGAAVANRNTVSFDYTTDLFIPPFKMFDYPTVSKAPSYIPYADQIEVAVHWKAIADIKAALLLGRGRGQTSRYVTAYGLQYAGQPYMELEYIVPNYSLPPVVSLPCWRTIHYQHDVKFTAQADGLALVKGEGSVNNQTITMAPIRIESLPSMIFVWVSDTSLQASGAKTTGTASEGFNMREYFGIIKNFSVTLNERLRVLSDRSQMDLYRMYRMYCPNSKMSFRVWSELRQVIVFRSDILCTEASQSVFSPTTITFKLDVQRAIQNRDAQRSACTQRIHVLFWYGNEALSLSSQSSSVTSLLLNKSDVREVRVGAGASAITEIMARNQ